MKLNITTAQRNAVVEKYLWCIDTVIRQNYVLMQAAHLDRDDVFQWLAMRLIRAVTNFDPDKGELEQHIFAQLKYELLNCKGSQRLYGLTKAPWDMRNAVISLDQLDESVPCWEAMLAA